MIEISQHDNHLVSPVVGIMPTSTKQRIEKVCHQTVRVTRLALFFKQTGSLKFRETFQLVAGKSGKKIKNQMSVKRNCCPKKGTDQKRAGGDCGQN
jgi:hypothetical protein